MIKPNAIINKGIHQLNHINESKLNNIPMPTITISFGIFVFRYSNPIQITKAGIKIRNIRARRVHQIDDLL